MTLSATLPSSLLVMMAKTQSVTATSKKAHYYLVSSLAYIVLGIATLFQAYHILVPLLLVVWLEFLVK